jgi:hypothetical protein
MAEEQNFIIRYSMFDIRYSSGSTASLLFSNYRPQQDWLNTYNGEGTDALPDINAGYP